MSHWIHCLFCFFGATFDPKFVAFFRFFYPACAVACFLWIYICTSTFVLGLLLYQLFSTSYFCFRFSFICGKQTARIHDSGWGAGCVFFLLIPSSIPPFLAPPCVCTLHSYRNISCPKSSPEGSLSVSLSELKKRYLTLMCNIVCQWTLLFDLFFFGASVHIKLIFEKFGIKPCFALHYLMLL